MSATTPDLLASLNPPQREAVEHEGSPLLILAGAGSGKTRVLVHRVAHLVRVRGCPPRAILAVTFTRKAANEMKERIRALLPEVAPDWWVGTFHALGARMLRSLAPHVGRERNFVIYDADDQLRLAKRVLEKSSIEWELHPREIVTAVEAAKRDLLSPEEAQEIAVGPREEALAEAYRLFERELAASNAFDFSDLVTIPVKLFDRDPEILRPYAERFREVLVDEFQDTNRSQYLMVRHLVSHHGGITVVGDDDQSIYAWRGANLENILGFEDDYERVHVVRLEENYRSTAVILEAAQGVIAHNQGRHAKRLWTSGSRGEPVTMLLTLDENGEARAVAQTVRRLVEEGRALGEIAVLYRTNAQSRALEDAFRRAMMRYVLVGTIRFYERKEVKDVLAYLRLVVNPRDEVSLLRILNVPPRGIGAKTVERLKRAVEGGTATLDELLAAPEGVPDLNERTRLALRRFAETLHRWRTAAETEGAALLARRVVEESGYDEYLLAAEDPQSEDRRDNVRELLASIETYVEERPEGALGDFLEDVSLSADVDSLEGAGDAVTLMTLHNAKGLEFPLVFIAGMEEGLLPHRTSLEEGTRSLEEERRLFYVGLTRAKERVWLSAARRRHGWDGFGDHVLSRFVSEIPPHCVETVDPIPTPAVGLKLPFPSGEGLHSWDARSPDAAASDPFPDYENDVDGGDWVDPRDLSPGEWVRHPQWGPGRIIGREGEGSSLKLIILFGNTRKKVVARYARLEPL